MHKPLPGFSAVMVLFLKCVFPPFMFLLFCFKFLIFLILPLWWTLKDDLILLNKPIPTRHCPCNRKGLSDWHRGSFSSDHSEFLITIHFYFWRPSQSWDRIINKIVNVCNTYLNSSMCPLRYLKGSINKEYKELANYFIFLCPTYTYIPTIMQSKNWRRPLAGLRGIAPGRVHSGFDETK